jgi:hypothetical protein
MTRRLLAIAVLAGSVAVPAANACQLLQCSPIPIRPCFLLATGEKYCIP